MKKNTYRGERVVYYVKPNKTCDMCGQAAKYFIVHQGHSGEYLVTFRFAYCAKCMDNEDWVAYDDAIQSCPVKLMLDD